jgi:hypothetical protein
MREFSTNTIEIEIGEICKIDGEILKCIETDISDEYPDCSKCVLLEKECQLLQCYYLNRKDHKSVIFVKCEEDNEGTK